eukprot:TRINITY_DN2986_c0_g1_i4.p1 TRINITY_DN2986_c0_g1~~TRINITY_DN2986_c0_g1_i4.p1  ORF type:complete len:881 (+),score=128.31 TRINITY_DN2986_c0_g1_i4:284-2644(+)
MPRAMLCAPVAAWGALSFAAFDLLPFLAFAPPGTTARALSLARVSCRCRSSLTAASKSLSWRPGARPLLQSLSPPSPAWSAALAAWHAVDMAGAVAACVACYAADVVFAVEPSGRVAPAWRGFHKLCICGFYASAVSLLAQLVPVVALPVAWVATGFECLRAWPTTCRDGCSGVGGSEELLARLEPHACSKVCRVKCDCTRRANWRAALMFAWRALALALLVGLVLVSIVPPLAFACRRAPDQDSYTDCDMTDPSMCALPFPSSFYLQEDSQSITGYHVNIGDGTLPATRLGKHLSPSVFNMFDGFSVSPTLLCYFKDVSTAGLVQLSNLSAYADSNSLTVIIDGTTGERVPHWVELDAMDGSKPLLMIQPAQGLRHATRYVVGLRHLKKKDGSPVPRSSFFDQLLKTKTGPQWVQLNSTVLPVLRTDGWRDDDILLAWDFVTMSQYGSAERLKRLRDAALEVSPINFQVYKVDEYDCDAANSSVAKTLWGTFDAPMFVSKDRGGFLLSGPYAAVQWEGTLPVEFVVEVPCSIARDPTPSFVLQYGHSFFSDRAEIQQTWLRELANRNRFITFATDWYGMSRLDLLTLLRTVLKEPTLVRSEVESALQGLVNADMMLRLMRSDLAKSDAMLVSPHCDAQVPPAQAPLTNGNFYRHARALHFCAGRRQSHRGPQRLRFLWYLAWGHSRRRLRGYVQRGATCCARIDGFTIISGRCEERTVQAHQLTASAHVFRAARHSLLPLPITDAVRHGRNFRVDPSHGQKHLDSNGHQRPCGNYCGRTVCCTRA